MDRLMMVQILGGICCVIFLIKEASACTPVTPSGSGSVLLYEPFNDESQFIHYGPFLSEGSAIFGIADGAGGGNYGGDAPPTGQNAPNFQGNQGSFLVARNLDNTGAPDDIRSTGMEAAFVTWPDLDVRNFDQSFDLSVLIGAEVGDGDEYYWEDDQDGVRFWYTLDRGRPKNLLWLSAEKSYYDTYDDANADYLSEDNHFLDRGNGVRATLTMREYTASFSIPPGCTNLTLTLGLGTTDTLEGIAIDELRITQATSKSNN